MAEAPHRATWLPILALTVNAGVWGVSWLPLRALQRYGVHPLWATALVMGLALLAISLWRRGAWRGQTTPLAQAAARTGSKSSTPWA